MLSSLCSGWEFTESFSEEFLAFQGGAETVRLPHTVRPTVQNYALPAHYEMICGYRRELDIPAGWADKRVFLQFDGAAHIAEVFVNGRKAADVAKYYLDMMWGEKKLVESGERNLDKDEDYPYIGHYKNMRGDYTKVACGIAVSEDGTTGWFDVNFH